MYSIISGWLWSYCFGLCSHYGDLGNITADDKGVAKVDITDKLVSIVGKDSVVGRTIVVSQTSNLHITTYLHWGSFFFSKHLQTFITCWAKYNPRRFLVALLNAGFQWVIFEANDNFITALGFLHHSSSREHCIFVKVKNLGSWVIPTSIFFKINIICMHVYGTSVNKEKLVVV